MQGDLETKGVGHTRLEIVPCSDTEKDLDTIADNQLNMLEKKKLEKVREEITIWKNEFIMTDLKS